MVFCMFIRGYTVLTVEKSHDCHGTWCSDRIPKAALDDCVDEPMRKLELRGAVPPRGGGFAFFVEVS
jgi:hypothetical protein